VLALRSHGEERVECHYTINLRGGNVKFACNNALHLLGEVAVQRLSLVKDIDELTWFITMLVADGLHLLNDITCQFHFFCFCHNL